MAAELTDEQIDAAVTQAVKTGNLPWAGFREDEEGRFTLPVLSRVHYGLVRLGLSLATQQATLGAEPVGTLYVSKFRGHLENSSFDYTGSLPDGTYQLYTAPPPTAEAGIQVHRPHVERLLAAIGSSYESEETLGANANSAMLVAAHRLEQAPTAEVEKDAALWRYVRHHWSNAQMRWNNDATNSLKSITLTIKTAHWTSGADDIERQLLAALHSDRHKASNS